MSEGRFSVLINMDSGAMYASPMPIEEMEKEVKMARATTTGLALAPFKVFNMNTGEVDTVYLDPYKIEALTTGTIKVLDGAHPLPVSREAIMDMLRSGPLGRPNGK